MNLERKDITLIPTAKSGRCPACGETISWQRWVGGRFYCPNCAIGLRLRPAYFSVLYCVALVLVSLGVYALGFRGLGLLSIVVLALLPVYWLVIFINVRIFPVDLEATADVRGLLYGVPDDEADATPAVQPDEEHVEPAPVNGPTAVRSPLFEPIKQHPTIAGVFLAVGFGALVLSYVWSGATAVLYRLRPDLVETRHGPRGFDMRAELREDAVAFTNMSPEPWLCVASLGSVDTAYRASFSLAPNETRAIPYADFRPARATTTPVVMRTVAREQLRAECRGPAGRVHAGSLE